MIKTLLKSKHALNYSRGHKLFAFVSGTCWLFLQGKSYTAISINVVRSRYKAVREDLKILWIFFLWIISLKSAMPRPSSEDIRRRAIWMKEILEYQVDKMAASLKMSLSFKL